MLRHHRTTIGYNAQVIIGAAVAYTTDATYEDFVNNAVNGEIGVFTEDGTLVSAELADGAKYFVAVKLGTEVRKSTLITKSDNFTFTPYEAPVKQVTHLGNNGTDGTLAPADGIVAGTTYGITIKETTPGYEPLPTWSYSITAAPGETLETLIDKLVARINADDSPENHHLERLVNAAKVSTTGISLTAVDFGVHFEAILREGFKGGQVRKTTLFNPGSGTGDWMQQLEMEGNVFAGTTTYNAQFAEDYGQPTNLVDTSLGYDVFIITNEKSIRSVGNANTKDTEFSKIVIAVPSEDPSPSDELQLALNGTALPL